MTASRPVSFRASNNQRQKRELVIMVPPREFIRDDEGGRFELGIRPTSEDARLFMKQSPVAPGSETSRFQWFQLDQKRTARNALIQGGQELQESPSVPPSNWGPARLPPLHRLGCVSHA